MGFHNARAAELLAAERKIGHAAARLAQHIALTTLDYAGDDGQEPRLYYAGRDAMALGLGYLVIHYDDGTDGQHARKAAHAAVKRAVAELTQSGILEVVQTGTGARRSTYRLMVPAAPPPTRQGYAHRAPARGTPTVPLGA